MSKKLTKKQLAKANKVTGGRAICSYGGAQIAIAGKRDCNARANNGVVIITTKKATKKSPKGITYYSD